MGIFSKLFRPSPLEKSMEDFYVPLFQTRDMSFSEAKNFFHDLLKQAKEDSLKDGSANLPQNYGDILLKKETTDAETTLLLAKKREEGVKDEDIRKWWNTHYLTRKMIQKEDEFSRGTAYFAFKEEWADSEKAAAMVRKQFVMYGSPDNTKHSSGDDRPIPYELKERINNYIMKKQQSDPEAFKRECETASSVNALIRNEIRRGYL